MRVVEFAFIVYPATDLQRSRAFYENVLQLTPAMSLDLPDGFWIEHDRGLTAGQVEGLMGKRHVPAPEMFDGLVEVLHF